MIKRNNVYDPEKRLSSVIDEIQLVPTAEKKLVNTEEAKKQLTPLEWFKLENKKCLKKYNLSKTKERPKDLIDKHRKQEEFIRYLASKSFQKQEVLNDSTSSLAEDSLIDDDSVLNSVQYDKKEPFLPPDLEDLSISLERFSFRSKPRESLAHFDKELSFSFNEEKKKVKKDAKFSDIDLDFSSWSISSKTDSPKVSMKKIKDLFIDPDAFNSEIIKEMEGFINKDPILFSYNLISVDQLKADHCLIVPHRKRVTKFLLIGLMRPDVQVVTDQWLLDVEEFKENMGEKKYFPKFCQQVKERSKIFRNISNVHIANEYRCKETNLSSKTLKRLIKLGNGRIETCLKKATVVICNEKVAGKISVSSSWIIDSVINGRLESKFLYLL